MIFTTDTKSHTHTTHPHTCKYDHCVIKCFMEVAHFLQVFSPAVCLNAYTMHTYSISVLYTKKNCCRLTGVRYYIYSREYRIHKKMMKQRSLVSRINRLQLICFIKAATSLDIVNSAMSWLPRLFANCTAVIKPDWL